MTPAQADLCQVSTLKRLKMSHCLHFEHAYNCPLPPLASSLSSVRPLLRLSLDHDTDFPSYFTLYITHFPAPGNLDKLRALWRKSCFILYIHHLTFSVLPPLFPISDRVESTLRWIEYYCKLLCLAVLYINEAQSNLSNPILGVRILDQVQIRMSLCVFLFFILCWAVMSWVSKKATLLSIDSLFLSL